MSSKGKSAEVVAPSKNAPVPLHPDQEGVTIGKGRNAPVMVGGKAYKVKKKITLPLLKQVAGQSVAIQFESPIYVGKDIKTKEGAAKEKPADLANIINLETGEEMVYIVSAVVKGNLDDLYPAEAIVGKCFAILKGTKVEGKRYNDYTVVELEAA